MKATRIIRSVLVAGSLALLVAAPALAERGHGHHKKRHHRHHHHRGCGHNGGVGAPELDPGMAGSAAVLLLGGTLALMGHRRREPNA
jgi:hypothetical protein